MSKIHLVDEVMVDDQFLHLKVDSQAYRLKWQNCSQKLAMATQEQRAYIDVSPSGYGLHWPLIDEDLAITPLLNSAESLVATAV